MPFCLICLFNNILTVCLFMLLLHINVCVCSTRFLSRESTPSLTMAGLDMDYCMIVIDKIINPLTPKDQLGNLVK